jgi:hypothetical protein
MVRGIITSQLHEYLSDALQPAHSRAQRSSFISSEAESPFLLQVGNLTSQVYTSATSDVDGWKLAKRWNLAETEGPEHESNVAIFTKGKTCALAFAGTNSPADMEKDMDVDGQAFCDKVSGASDGGWRVHRGFLHKANGFLKGRRFEEFNDFLNDKGKCDKVVVAGHSLGGAVANLVSACANKTHASQASKAFKADYLFTFGAPGVSQLVQLDNKADSGGCFPGARIHNSDDPVPSLTSGLGFYHPKVMEVRLDGQEAGGVQAWSCNEASRKDKPALDLTDTSDAQAHEISSHIKRMKQLNGQKSNKLMQMKMEDFSGDSSVLGPENQGREEAAPQNALDRLDEMASSSGHSDSAPPSGGR